MEGCYLTGLPKRIIRTLAGFSSDGLDLFMPRAMVEPSVELQQAIFPEADKWFRIHQDSNNPEGKPTLLLNRRPC